MTLFVCAVILMSDEQRMLISTLLVASNESLTDLNQPLFFYIALFFSGIGLVIGLIGLIGCWAAFINKFCVLYIVSIYGIFL